MDTQQNLIETTTIKTEIADDEVSLCNLERRNTEYVVTLNGIKGEEIVEGDTDSALEEGLSIKTEFKSEDTEEILKCERLNLFEMQEDFITVKSEIKSEEMDITYPSLYFECGSSLPNTTTYTKDDSFVKIEENHSSNSKMLKKQWQRREVNQLSTEVPNISFSFHCDYSSDLKGNLVSDMLVHNKKKRLFSCINCNYSSKDKQELMQHAVKVHSAYYKKYLCTQCKKPFKNKMLLDDHTLKKHQNNIESVSSIVHNCLICNYKSTFLVRLRRHTAMVHTKNCDKYLCTCCGKQFKEKKSLDDHIIKNHQHLIYTVSSKVHDCPTCDYKTTQKSHLRCHTMKVHLGNHEDYSCTCCEKRFKFKLSLDDHIIKKHPNFTNLVNKKVYSCSSCEYKAARKNHLKQHMMHVHIGEYEKHSCTCCKKYFKYKISLDDHIIKNHENLTHLVRSKVHSCSTCSYKTTRKNNLRKHTAKIHFENYEEHSCRYCKKCYLNKKSLDDHMIKNHKNFTGLVSCKLHSCPTCDYKTTNKSLLIRHTKKVHTGNYGKHLCTFCQKHFKHKRSLHDHIVKNHKNSTDLVSSKIHSCTACDYKTTLKSLLRRHMLNAHSD